MGYKDITPVTLDFDAIYSRDPTSTEYAMGKNDHCESITS